MSPQDLGFVVLDDQQFSGSRQVAQLIPFHSRFCVVKTARAHQLEPQVKASTPADVSCPCSEWGVLKALFP